MKLKTIKIQDKFVMKPLHGNKISKIVSPKSKSSISILSDCCPTITTI
jgi:hypothetical protein